VCASQIEDKKLFLSGRQVLGRLARSPRIQEPLAHDVHLHSKKRRNLSPDGVSF